MIRKSLIALIFLIICFASAFTYLISTNRLTILSPTGLLALQERNLMLMAILIMLCLALPVLGAFFFIAWRYRADNPKATYDPEWTGSKMLKLMWWALPASLVVIFSFIIWYGAHALDPYKTLSSAQKPMTIQVVALQWKWLFIYPQEHIATVNFVQFPVHTPVHFQLTADAPMNSFWIPSLSGQIYAMSSMETQLHILSDKTGDFPGEESEINGSGYSGMRFTARVSTQAAFDGWVKYVKGTAKPLDSKIYNSLAKPSEDTPVTYYSAVDNNLYNSIIMKYMEPSSAHTNQ